MDHFPIEPFVEFFRSRVGALTTMRERDRLRTFLTRLEKKESISFVAVDRECYRYGYHPTQIYGDAW